ncbi:MAG: hypothetical protein V4568_07815, partial [Pseudomonadota bacterium]
MAKDTEPTIEPTPLAHPLATSVDKLRAYGTFPIAHGVGEAVAMGIIYGLVNGHLDEFWHDPLLHHFEHYMGHGIKAELVTQIVLAAAEAPIIAAFEVALFDYVAEGITGVAGHAHGRDSLEVLPRYPVIPPKSDQVVGRDAVIAQANRYGAKIPVYPGEFNHFGVEVAAQAAADAIAAAAADAALAANASPATVRGAIDGVLALYPIPGADPTEVAAHATAQALAQTATAYVANNFGPNANNASANNAAAVATATRAGIAAAVAVGRVASGPPAAPTADEMDVAYESYKKAIEAHHKKVPVIPPHPGLRPNVGGPKDKEYDRELDAHLEAVRAADKFMVEARDAGITTEDIPFDIDNAGNLALRDPNGQPLVTIATGNAFDAHRQNLSEHIAPGAPADVYHAGIEALNKAIMIPPHPGDDNTVANYNNRLQEHNTKLALVNLLRRNQAFPRPVPIPARPAPLLGPTPAARAQYNLDLAAYQNAVVQHNENLSTVAIPPHPGFDRPGNADANQAGYDAQLQAHQAKVTAVTTALGANGGIFTAVTDITGAVVGIPNVDQITAANEARTEPPAHTAGVDTYLARLSEHNAKVEQYNVLAQPKHIPDFPSRFQSDGVTPNPNYVVEFQKCIQAARATHEQMVEVAVNKSNAIANDANNPIHERIDKARVKFEHARARAEYGSPLMNGAITLSFASMEASFANVPFESERFSTYHHSFTGSALAGLMFGIANGYTEVLNKASNSVEGIHRIPTHEMAHDELGVVQGLWRTNPANAAVTGWNPGPHLARAAENFSRGGFWQTMAHEWEDSRHKGREGVLPATTSAHSESPLQSRVGAVYEQARNVLNHYGCYVMGSFQGLAAYGAVEVLLHHHFGGEEHMNHWQTAMTEFAAVVAFTECGDLAALGSTLSNRPLTTDNHAHKPFLPSLLEALDAVNYALGTGTKPTNHLSSLLGKHSNDKWHGRLINNSIKPVFNIADRAWKSKESVTRLPTTILYDALNFLEGNTIGRVLQQDRSRAYRAAGMDQPRVLQLAEQIAEDYLDKNYDGRDDLEMNDNAIARLEKRGIRVTDIANPEQFAELQKGALVAINDLIARTARMRKYVETEGEQQSGADYGAFINDFIGVSDNIKVIADVRKTIVATIRKDIPHAEKNLKQLHILYLDNLSDNRVPLELRDKMFAQEIYPRFLKRQLETPALTPEQHMADLMKEKANDFKIGAALAEEMKNAKLLLPPAMIDKIGGDYRRVAAAHQELGVPFQTSPEDFVKKFLQRPGERELHQIKLSSFYKSVEVKRLEGPGPEEISYALILTNHDGTTIEGPRVTTLDLSAAQSFFDTPDSQVDALKALAVARWAGENPKSLREIAERHDKMFAYEISEEPRHYDNIINKMNECSRQVETKIRSLQSQAATSEQQRKWLLGEIQDTFRAVQVGTDAVELMETVVATVETEGSAKVLLNATQKLKDVDDLKALQTTESERILQINALQGKQAQLATQIAGLTGQLTVPASKESKDLSSLKELQGQVERDLSKLETDQRKLKSPETVALSTNQMELAKLTVDVKVAQFIRNEELRTNIKERFEILKAGREPEKILDDLVAHLKKANPENSEDIKATFSEYEGLSIDDRARLNYLKKLERSQFLNERDQKVSLLESMKADEPRFFSTEKQQELTRLTAEALQDPLTLEMEEELKSFTPEMKDELKALRKKGAVELVDAKEVTARQQILKKVADLMNGERELSSIVDDRQRAAAKGKLQQFRDEIISDLTGHRNEQEVKFDNVLPGIPAKYAKKLYDEAAKRNNTQSDPTEFDRIFDKFSNQGREIVLDVSANADKLREPVAEVLISNAPAYRKRPGPLTHGKTLGGTFLPMAVGTVAKLGGSYIGGPALGFLAGQAASMATRVAATKVSDFKANLYGLHKSIPKDEPKLSIEEMIHQEVDVRIPCLNAYNAEKKARGEEPNSAEFEGVFETFKQSKLVTEAYNKDAKNSEKMPDFNFEALLKDHLDVYAPAKAAYEKVELLFGQEGDEEEFVSLLENFREQSQKQPGVTFEQVLSDHITGQLSKQENAELSIEQVETQSKGIAALLNGGVIALTKDAEIQLTALGGSRTTEFIARKEKENFRANRSITTNLGIAAKSLFGANTPAPQDVRLEEIVVVPSVATPTIPSTKVTEAVDDKVDERFAVGSDSDSDSEVEEEDEDLDQELDLEAGPQVARAVTIPREVPFVRGVPSIELTVPTPPASPSLTALSTPPSPALDAAKDPLTEIAAIPPLPPSIAEKEVA